MFLGILYVLLDAILKVRLWVDLMEDKVISYTKLLILHHLPLF